MRETRRYLGLELAGAKNHKTALAALEFYPKEKKLFLLDIYDKIAGHRPSEDAAGLGEGAEPIEDSRERVPSKGVGASKKNKQAVNGGPFGITTSGDRALLELLSELAQDSPRSVTLGVNVPLELPPSIMCARKACAKPSESAVASTRWMRDAHRKAEKQARADPRLPRVTEYTTYTQRPVELWIRYQVMSRLPEAHRFEIDETLGGNKAPLTARMHFIRRHLGALPVIEAWPKLTVSMLAQSLEIPRRVIEDYRKLETGHHAREDILERLTGSAGPHDVFIYERDVRKLAASLAAFDAFFCAYTAYLSDNRRCAKIPPGFPAASGWVQYPQ